MKKSRLLGAVCAAVFSFITLPTQAGLISVLGGQAYYDDVADLTWLANANVNGVMNWQAAKDWAAALDIDGVTGWRLPMAHNSDVPSCSGYNCTGSEMGNMFYNVLGGVAGSSITTTHNSNYDLFSNVQSDDYWSSTEYAPNSAFAWDFGFGDGLQNLRGKGYNGYAWAVRAGDVRPVYSCVGDTFETPFNEIITLINKVKKAIPVKMSLVDADGNLITESDISSPPVVNVLYTPGAGADGSNNSDLVPPGLADVGNEFRPDYPYWVINLATKQFTAAGTYEVTAVAGDDSYIINASSCSGTFIRLP